MEDRGSVVRLTVLDNVREHQTEMGIRHEEHFGGDIIVFQFLFQPKVLTNAYGLKRLTQLIPLDANIFKEAIYENLEAYWKFICRVYLKLLPEFQYFWKLNTQQAKALMRSCDFIELSDN